MASPSYQGNNTAVGTNQLREIGMYLPPNMASTDSGMLQSASPMFSDTLRVDTSAQEAAVAYCRSNTGFSGLRKLQKEQATNTYYEPGCGWMFQQGSGAMNPQINRGVFATYNGIPVMGREGQGDVLTGTGFIEMDLQKAEQRVADSIANGLGNNCTNLQLLTSENKPYLGYCKTTGKIIPITSVGGSVKAKYDNDGNLKYSCAPADIVPASSAPSGCPQTLSRINIVEPRIHHDGGHQRPPDVMKPAPEPELIKQGFANLQDEYTCQTPFTRDCLIQNVRNAGCTDKGSILAALTSSTSPAPYDGPLASSAAYRYYVSKTSMPQNLFRDGSAADQQTANDIFNALANASSDASVGPGLQSAARDLCLEAGYFSNTYNFCAELNNTDTINAGNIACIQNLWRNGGGDSMGSEYPQIGKWNGSNVGAFITFRDSIKAAMDSTNKQVQADAINKFIGTQTFGTQISLDLDKNANTKGSEVVWMYTAGSSPVILRCDLMMSSDGEGFPDINEGTNQVDWSARTGQGAWPTFKYKLGLPAVENISLITAFEYRPPTNTRIAFKVAVDDAFMIGYNQNPFQSTETANLDWGSWKLQALGTYTSGAYNIDTSAGKRNTFLIKYANEGGYGAFNMSIADDPTNPTNFKRVAKDASARQHMYLTQEPLAPWLQYEICSRPNGGRGTSLGFFEKRWNGPSSTTNQFSFDVITNGVTYQTDTNSILSVPGTKPYMSFTSQPSRWYTAALFAYSAFKTITLMVRPTSQTIPVTGIFQHGQDPSSANRGGYSLYLKNQGSSAEFVLDTGAGTSIQSAPCVLNAWNFVVIQYVDTDGYGIRAITMHAAAYSDLNANASSRATFLAAIKTAQSSSAPVTTPIMRDVGDITKYSGRLILGKPGWTSAGNASTSFLGDIAWLHGFRNFIGSDSELYAELNQTWISRWPNMDGAATTGVPRTKTVIANNGSVSCDTYCDGVGGRSWNGELPHDWYGAKCIGTTVSGNTCSTVPGMSKGPYCTGNPPASAPYGCPQNCVCQETGTGWNQDRPAWFDGVNAFQSPRLPAILSDQRSRGRPASTAFQPSYTRNNERAYVRQQPPKTSIFDLFKW